MEEEVSLKQHEAILFAREISDRLELARARGEFDELTLVAAPAFLGLLRENLNAATRKLVVRTIDKNLVQRSEAENPRSPRIRIRGVGRDVIGPTLRRRVAAVQWFLMP